MQPFSFSSMWILLLVCLLGNSKAYPSNWPIYVSAPRDYPEDDNYYLPKTHYFYDAPTRQEQEIYGRIPYPYYYDTYGHFADEDPIKQDERLAALPIGQETWYENEAEPGWRSNDLDDVNAAFLDNLIVTQMAKDAHRHKEYPMKNYAAVDNADHFVEDEDVKELKALAGSPAHTYPKSISRVDHDHEYYDDFINWNGNKRSAPAETTSTAKPKVGQDEVMVPRPAHTYHQRQNEDKEKDDLVYEKMTKMLMEKNHLPNDAGKARKINKRFVSGDFDLVAELRGLKHRIPT